MQSFSTWRPQGEIGVLSRQGFELGFYCRVYARRKALSRIGFPLCFCGVTDRALVCGSLRTSRRGACCGNLGFSVVHEFDSGCSNLRVRFSKPNGSFPSACFVSACALEQEAIEQKFLEGEQYLEEVPRRRESGAFNDLDWHGSAEDVEGKGEVDVNNEEEAGGKKSARVDVRALAWNLQHAKTADDVEEVLKDVGELPLQVYSSLIRGFGRDKRMDCALALVSWLKRKKVETNGRIGPNQFIYNSFLGAVKQSEQFEEMECVLTDMAQEGIAPNIVTYNTIMAIYLEQGHARDSLGVLDKIQEKGLTPSPVTYSTALLAYQGMEDGSGVLNFMVDLKGKYLKDEIGKDDDDEDWGSEFVKFESLTKRICYQLMRQWLVSGENLSANVLQLLAEMDKAGLPFVQAEEERLVWACTRAEHYIVAKELYDRLRERHSEIKLSVCNHVIWLMGKAKKWWAALEIYEDLLDKGPQPNNMSYELIVSHFNILLTAAKKRGIWKWGVRLLNKMEEKGLKPGSKQWNAVLVACSKAAETSAAVQIFRRMVERGEKPTVLSYGALLSALEKGKLYDEARRVWDHMIKVGVQPNLYAYTTMASVFTGQGKFKMVDAIINEMSSSGIEPTVVTYNAIITGCGRNGMSSAAYEWFHRMKVRQISPNEITYEMLIEALAKEGKPRLAYELYVRSRNEGLNLSSKAYDAVMRAAQLYGATIDLAALGPRPLDKKKTVHVRKTLSEFSTLADVPRRSKPFERREIYTTKNEGT